MINHMEHKPGRLKQLINVSCETKKGDRHMVTELEKKHQEIVNKYVALRDKVTANLFDSQLEKNYFLGQMDALEFVLFDLGLVHVVYDI